MDIDQSQTLHKLHFLDADCMLGPYGLPTLEDGSAASLIKKMDEFGIAEACASSAFALEYSIEAGNQQLLKEIRLNPRLHPIWTVAAHHTGEFPSPSILRIQLAEHGVRMVKLVLHAGEGYLDTLDIVTYEELFDMLAAERIPLHLDYHSFTDPDIQALREALRAWPSLPMLITVPKQDKLERVLYHLWEHFENLLMTLSGYQLLGGIERIVERFGAGVLLFSSHYPYFTPVQSMLQLIYSEISMENKQRIAGENLLELLNNSSLGAEVRL